ncbi:hypothetical protein HYDPIDRAFT_79247 [Hydnomerulius pinastri MD-312]|nr:hypothetical protein HYDPIDRAFT_79247 [Hydnomerulius pinastri MD-312]
MAPRKKCPLCGSKQWRKDSTTGLITCSEGHVRQNYRNESGDADEMVTHTMKKRTLKSGRKKKERKSKADAKLYHGERARFHYYQCLQLLLRKQVAALIALWSLPPEFETVCRDLWALHLNLIPNPPSAEPFHHSQEQNRVEREPDGTPSRQRSRSRPRNEDAPADDSSSSSDEEGLDPEIAVLLQENSEISSSSDEGSPNDEGNPRSRNKRHTQAKNPFVSRSDRPENTIAVLLLACWTIRLPVVYQDFINVIDSHSLPFLDHVRFLPPALTRHLTKHAVQALSPHHAPRTLSLHRLTSRLANRLYGTFDVLIPELNAAPVLWRVVQQCFSGTPILYYLTKRLGHELSLPLSLHHSLAPSLSSIKRGDTESHKYDNVPPEIALVATAIVVLKLVYGLDGKKRLPRHPDDAACAFPDADQFLATLKEASGAETCVNAHRFSSRVPMSVGDLDDAILDEYLDFCQKVLVGPHNDEHRILDNYFPLANGIAEVTPTALMADLKVQGLSSTKVNDDNLGVIEPGESYTIYHSRDTLGNLSPELDLLVQRSAGWAGVDGDFLCGVVERYERRLVRWWTAERQAQGEMNLDEP